MNSGMDTNKYLEVFIEEATENLQDLNQLFLNWKTTLKKNKY